MILNLLQQEGITGRVDGEYLQGGVGELQTMNMVRVMIDESDYSKAQAIIHEWESKPVTDPIGQAPIKNSSNFGIGLLFGVLIGSGLTFWAYNSPVTNDGIDYNHDGQLDEKWLYKGNRISKVTSDRNLDGKEDVVEQYDRKGLIYKAEVDDDFDGIFETVYKYRHGNVYLQESDINNDGSIDYRAHSKDGVFYESEIFEPYLNTPKKKQKYLLNKMVSAEYDSNNDGIFDVIYEYDFYEEIKTKSNKALPPTPKEGAAEL